MDYNTIISKVTKLIKKQGIPRYLKAWKVPNIPANIANMSYDEFIKFLDNYVKTYHGHSLIDSQKITTKMIKTTKNFSEKDWRQMPKFFWDDNNKIGRIVYYSFILGYDKERNLRDQNKLVKIVAAKIDDWKKKEMVGLIIDLQNHIGGSFYPFAYSLKNILGDTTLFGLSSQRISKKDKKWMNFIKGKTCIRHAFLSRALAYNNPIAIVVSKITESAGEFAAAVFKGRNNTRFFGENTCKKLSTNRSVRINDDIVIHFPITLVTTVDLVFRNKECIDVDIKTDTPVQEAKKWIISNKQ